MFKIFQNSDYVNGGVVKYNGYICIYIYVVLYNYNVLFINAIYIYG